MIPQPIFNIVYNAGLDAEKMGAIENTAANEEKIRGAFRNKWKDGFISDEVICNDLIDYKGAPEWIRRTVQDERLAIQREILLRRE